MRCAAVWLACALTACLSPPDERVTGDPDADGGSKLDGGGLDADGGDTETCPGVPFGDLVDPFDDDLGDTWQVLGDGPNCEVVADNGELIVDSDGAEPCGVQTEAAHAFYDQAVTIQFADTNEDTGGVPDIAFAVYLVGWSAQVQYREGSVIISNCPNGKNCGTVSSAEELPTYWRLRHGAEENAIIVGFSSTGELYTERPALVLGEDADPTCAVVFVGSRGDTTGTADIHIDGVNVD